MTEMPLIPAGSLIAVTTGEYTDNYKLKWVFRARIDIDVEVVRRQWLQEHPEQEEEYCFEEDKFMTWVVSIGLVESMGCYKWHLSSYSCIDDMNVEQVA